MINNYIGKYATISDGCKIGLGCIIDNWCVIKHSIPSGLHVSDSLHLSDKHSSLSIYVVTNLSDDLIAINDKILLEEDWKKYFYSQSKKHLFDRDINLSEYERLFKTSLKLKNIFI